MEITRVQRPYAMLPSRWTMKGDRKKATPTETASDIQFRTTLRPIWNFFDMVLRQHYLSAIKRFCIPGRCVRFHPSQPHDPKKCFFIEPALIALGSKAFHED